MPLASDLVSARGNGPLLRKSASQDQVVSKRGGRHWRPQFAAPSSQRLSRPTSQNCSRSSSPARSVGNQSPQREAPPVCGSHSLFRHEHLANAVAGDCSARSSSEHSTGSRFSRLSQRSVTKALSSEEMVQIRVQKWKRDHALLVQQNEKNSWRAIHCPDLSFSKGSRKNPSKVTVPKEFALSAPVTPRRSRSVSRDASDSGGEDWSSSLRRCSSQRLRRGCATPRCGSGAQMHLRGRGVGDSSVDFSLSLAGASAPTMSSTRSALELSTDTSSQAQHSHRDGQLSSEEFLQMKLQRKRDEVRALAQRNAATWRRAKEQSNASVGGETFASTAPLTVPMGPSLHTERRGRSSSRGRSATPERRTASGGVALPGACARENVAATRHVERVVSARGVLGVPTPSRTNVAARAVASKLPAEAKTPISTGPRRWAHDGKCAEERAEQARVAAHAKRQEQEERERARHCVFRRGASASQLRPGRSEQAAVAAMRVGRGH